MTEKDKNNDIEGMLVLVKGLSPSGEVQYAYATIPFEKYEAFMSAQAAGAYDLSAFGTILCHGKGLEPPIEVQTKMEKTYGALHDFEQQIIDAIKTADV